MPNKVNPPIGIGMEVFFRSFVYDPPYAPYYDAYKGHKFKVVRECSGHFDLTCLTGDVVVSGYVHPEVLKRA